MKAILIFLVLLAIIGLSLGHVAAQLDPSQPTFAPQFDGRQMNPDGLASVLINMTGNNLAWQWDHPLNLMGFGHKGRQIREDPRMSDDGKVNQSHYKDAFNPFQYPDASNIQGLI